MTTPYRDPSLPVAPRAHLSWARVLAVLFALSLVAIALPFAFMIGVTFEESPRAMGRMILAEWRWYVQRARAFVRREAMP